MANKQAFEALVEKWRPEYGQVWEADEQKLAIGDCLDRDLARRLMGTDAINGLVADPPYASGGTSSASRSKSVTSKYQQSGTVKYYPEFPGDQRDQRSWYRWCVEWLSDVRKIASEEAYAIVFSDWRQLPTITDAIQAAGWVWRGINSWDKTDGARMAHLGYFRTQCEFAVWGTNGHLKARYTGGAKPGCFRCSVDSDKKHLTQKPIAVMEWLISIVPGGVIVDPFCGSGTTLLAAAKLGYRGRAFEVTPVYAAVALERLDAAGLKPRMIPNRAKSRR